MEKKNWEKRLFQWLKTKFTKIHRIKIFQPEKLGENQEFSQKFEFKPLNSTTGSKHQTPTVETLTSWIEVILRREKMCQTHTEVNRKCVSLFLILNSKKKIFVQKILCLPTICPKNAQNVRQLKNFRKKFFFWELLFIFRTISFHFYSY